MRDQARLMLQLGASRAGPRRPSHRRPSHRQVRCPLVPMRRPLHPVLLEAPRPHRWLPRRAQYRRLTTRASRGSAIIRRWSWLVVRMLHLPWPNQLIDGVCTATVRVLPSHGRGVLAWIVRLVTLHGHVTAGWTHPILVHVLVIRLQDRKSVV